MAVETCVLTHMSKATKHIDKDLSSVKKPSQPYRTVPPSTLRNLVVTDTSVNVMLHLFPGDVVVIPRPKEEAITEGVFLYLSRRL